MNVLFLCSERTAMPAAVIAKSIVASSVDESEFGDLMLTGAPTRDQMGGCEAIAQVAAIMDLDVLIVFGKTSNSVGVEMKPLDAHVLILPNHGRATKVVKLPSAASRWWHDQSNVDLAIECLRTLYRLPQNEIGVAQFAWPQAVWN